MKKSIDFSKGVRGKHAGLNLKVLGAATRVWSVCVTTSSKDLIPFKVYEIEVFPDSAEVRSRNEQGKIAFYPNEWFAPIEVSRSTEELLKRAA